MNEQEVLDRAGFQILMSARAHVGMEDEDTDRILAAACLRCTIKRVVSNVGYMVGWRTFQDTSKHEGVGREITLSDGQKKYTFFKDYTENE